MNGLRTPLPPAEQTWMHREASAAPAAMRAQLEANRAQLAELGALLRARAPRAVATCARGSSDHAATYAQYLFTTHCGLLAPSVAPSVYSVYRARLDLRGTVFLAISQSGRSPDLLHAVEAARADGALTIALCNQPDAPLCQMAEYCVPVRAGTEHGVAATKSFLLSLSALLQLVAAWTGEASLQEAVDALPDQLQQALGLDWSPALPLLTTPEHLYVIGRGPGLSLAQEAALKFKETCGLHAEAFSSAEVRHGPFALPGPHFPVLMFAQADATRPGLEQLASELGARGTPVILAGGEAAGALSLPGLASRARELSPVATPIVQALPLYRLAAMLAVARGFDPDRPPHLCKITETT